MRASGRGLAWSDGRPLCFVSAETLAALLDCEVGRIEALVAKGLLPRPTRVAGELERWNWQLVRSLLEEEPQARTVRVLTQSAGASQADAWDGRGLAVGTHSPLPVNHTAGSRKAKTVPPPGTGTDATHYCREAGRDPAPDAERETSRPLEARQVSRNLFDRRIDEAEDA